MKKNKNWYLFLLKKKLRELVDDTEFEIKLSKNGNRYERALTYKLMQSPIMSEVIQVEAFYLLYFVRIKV